MYNKNKELAHIFEEMADYYRLRGPDDRFRVIAYENAAQSVEHLTQDIIELAKRDEKELVKILGIGKSTAAKLKEFALTGKVQKYEELKKDIPHALVDLMQIQGVGPKTLKKLQHRLGIESKEELQQALNRGKVEDLKGFGAKTVQNIRAGLAQLEKSSGRILLIEALDITDQLRRELSKCKEIGRMEFAGSIRRRKATIGDVDILVTAKSDKRKEVIDFFTSATQVSKVLAKGDTKASIVIDDSGRQVDLRVVDSKEWGAALLYFTGSKEHNVHLRTIAKDNGYKINEYGLYDSKNDKRLTGETEEGIYEELGLTWIPPEMRENEGEIELAGQDQLPVLVEASQVKGDFHLHSDWSDGKNSIEELATFVRKNYPYEYIVLTDHSKSSVIAGGLTEEDLKQQWNAIDKVNSKLVEDFIKCGAEVDILADGSLDYPDRILDQLDWVTASIHSRFKQDNTERILKACDNPFVNAISHPTGRLIGKRKEYAVDMKRVIEKAIDTGTALEINAQPQRMDLDDHLSRMAQQMGAKLVIGTDSHDLMSFNYMDLGVAVARRGWCAASDLLNTQSWREVAQLVSKKRASSKVVS